MSCITVLVIYAAHLTASCVLHEGHVLQRCIKDGKLGSGFLVQLCQILLVAHDDVAYEKSRTSELGSTGQGTSVGVSKVHVLM